MNYKKGFTLIELLVVIAIIGILSSVVLASLNTARSKGADAAIKGNLNGVRAQAELYYDSHDNSYAPTDRTYLATGCEGITDENIFKDTNIKNAIVSAQKAGVGTAGVSCIASSTSWALSAQLKSNTALYFCIDSTGNSTTTTGAGIGINDAVCS